MAKAKLAKQLVKYLDDLAGNSTDQIAARIRKGEQVQKQLSARIVWAKRNGVDPAELTRKYNDNVARLKAYRFALDNPQSTMDLVPGAKSVAPKPAAPKTKEVWWGSGQNKEFSNLADRPFVYQGKDYRSVEHAYQTLKTGEFDPITYEKYFKVPEGRKIRGGKPMPGSKTQALMDKLVYESFKQNPNAAQALLNTGDTVFTHTRDKGMWNKAFPDALHKTRSQLQGTKVGDKTKVEVQNLQKQIDAIKGMTPRKKQLIQKKRELMGGKDVSTTKPGEADQKRLLQQRHQLEQRLEDLDDQIKFYEENEIEAPAGLTHQFGKTKEQLKQVDFDLANPDLRHGAHIPGGVNDTPKKLKAAAPIAAAPVAMSPTEDIQASYGIDDNALFSRYFGDPGSPSDYTAPEIKPITHTEGHSQTLNPNDAFKGGLEALRYGVGRIPGSYAEFGAMVAPYSLPGMMGFDAAAPFEHAADRSHAYYNAGVAEPETPWQNTMALTGEIGGDIAGWYGVGKLGQTANRGIDTARTAYQASRVNPGTVDETRRALIQAGPTAAAVTGIGGLAGLKAMSKPSTMQLRLSKHDPIDLKGFPEDPQLYDELTERAYARNAENNFDSTDDQLFRQVDDEYEKIMQSRQVSKMSMDELDDGIAKILERIQNSKLTNTERNALRDDYIRYVEEIGNRPELDIFTKQDARELIEFAKEPKGIFSENYWDAAPTF